MVGAIAAKAGFSHDGVQRLSRVIAEGEFMSSNHDYQLLYDADSISFFDNNSPYYLAEKGPTWTMQKMQFTYNRASFRAREIMMQEPDFNQLKINY